MTSEIDLLDANVWLALVVDKHIHHKQAKSWFESRGPRQCAFCRITQFALLRHLTNRAIMGPHTRTPVDAWTIYEDIASKDDVVFLTEPEEMIGNWRKLAAKAGASGSWWTDTYLAAFAEASRTQFVTFDQSFPKHSGLELKILKV
jgi:toxin-antitoxin system PIN domain toxin